MTDVVLCERLEHDDLIQTVQKLRTEVATKVIHNLLLCLRLDVTLLIDTVKKVRRTNVGCHDQDRVLEINGTSL